MAAAQRETVIVDDVASDPRYLSCSVDTKSEIVTPIRMRGQFVAEIDVDSLAWNAFQSEDREFLERCAEMVGRYTERIDGFRP
ncbi:MAG: GAF domain-containing protein [Acidobacteriota bacterium]